MSRPFRISTVSSAIGSISLTPAEPLPCTAAVLLTCCLLARSLLIPRTFAAVLQVKHLITEITGDTPGAPRGSRVRGPLRNAYDSADRFWIAQIPDVKERAQLVDLLG